MKFRLLFVGIILVAIAVSMNVSACPVPEAPTMQERLSQWGKIDAAYTQKDRTSSPSEASIAAKGKDIVIFQDDVDKIAARYALSGIANGKQLAIDALIKQETMYRKAVQNGFQISEDTLDEALAEQRAFLESAENYSEFLEYLKGTGWTADAYWENQRDSIRKQVVIERYVTSLNQQYVQEHKASGWKEAEEYSWPSTLEAEIAQWISDQQVVVYR